MRFFLREGSAIEALHDRVLLFSEPEQQLTEMNETGALLLERLGKGATSDELAKALRQIGADEAASISWSGDFLVDMSRLGLLESEPPAREPAGSIEQRISLAGRSIAISYDSAELFSSIGGSFSHLAAPGSVPQAAYRLGADQRFVLISKDCGRAGVVEKALAAVKFKGLLLEDILASAGQLFALHSACLAKGNSALLLLGPPGAGKTTLALALAAQGYELGSDDVTLVFELGRVCGVPLASGVKQGAWALLPAGTLDELPVHQRPDGQNMRFVPPPNCPAQSPLAVSTVIRVRRSSDGDPVLMPIAPKEALAELLAESRSPSGDCSIQSFRALAELARGAQCFELHYSDANEAARLIGENGAHE
jgi:hypothetical protein